MVKWVTLWCNLGFSLKTLVAPLQPELFTVSVSWNDRTLPLSLDEMLVYSRCPPLPHISSVCPDSSQVAINSPAWRGTGWEQSAFLKNITKRVGTLIFRFRVQSAESGVRGPDMSQLVSLWNRWTLLRQSKQTKVYLIPLTLILGTGLTLWRLGTLREKENRGITFRTRNL